MGGWQKGIYRFVKSVFNDSKTLTVKRKLLKVKANWIKLGIFCDEDLEVVPGWRFLLVPEGCLHVRFHIEIFVSSAGLFTCAISDRDFC